MKPLECRIWSGRIQSFTPPAVSSATLAVLFLLMELSSWGTGTVTNCTEANLRAAMEGGGTVTFACAGTITLGSTITNSLNTVLDGNGQQITISGNNAARVFCNNTNVSFTLINLTIADGNSLGGSAILNLGGTVNLTAVLLRSNAANLYAENDDLSPRAGGGAIFNRGGTVNATNCNFADNSAQTPMEISTAWVPQVYGGAIRNEAGQVTLRSCTFVGNRAAGGAVMFSGSGANGDPGFGGAIHNSGALLMADCSFTSNCVSGGSSPSYPQWEGFSGCEGSGGAIFNQGVLTIERTSFSGNLAIGGNGCFGGVPWDSLDGTAGGGGGVARGGAIANHGQLWVTQSLFSSNDASGGTGGSGADGVQFMTVGGSGGGGGTAGAGAGGGVYNSTTASLINCTLAFNTGKGGAGGRGGNGAGWVSGSSGSGGAGGHGGAGIGGIAGSCNLTNCTVARNVGISGAGGAGGAGSFGNPLPGAPGTPGPAWGTSATGSFLNLLLASNSPAGNDSFPDPQLGPLADNGGPTLTMALLPGSPAIEAGSLVGAPATDQRGVGRPQGAAMDIGAYEFEFTPRIISARFQPPSAFWLKCCGLPNQIYALQTSTNLLDWLDVTNLCPGANGLCEFTCPDAGDSNKRFFRTKALASP